jgi:hypothetical protein
MMATPSDLEDFVPGFSLTEGIVRSVDEIRGIEVVPQQDGIVVTVDLAPGRFREHLARRRNLSGRTSCGLCGVETLEEMPHGRGGQPAGDANPGVRDRGGAWRRWTLISRWASSPARFMLPPGATRKERSWRCAKMSAGIMRSTS